MNSLGLCVLKAVALHRGLCLISVWMYVFPCLASSPQTEPRMQWREQPWVPCSFLLVGISFHSFPPVTRFGVLLIRLASYKSYLCSSPGVPTTSGGQRAPWGVRLSRRPLDLPRHLFPRKSFSFRFAEYLCHPWVLYSSTDFFSPMSWDVGFSLYCIELIPYRKFPMLNQPLFSG